MREAGQNAVLAFRPTTEIHMLLRRNSCRTLKVSVKSRGGLAEDN